MSTAPAVPIASSSPSPSSDIVKPTQATLALRTKVETFIDAQYKIWKQQPHDKIGQLATPEVLEVVKKTSTAFHCDESGGIPLLWVKKDMPREALKYPEVDYWTNQAGPGPKQEQEEVVIMHGVPAEAMETIRRSNDHFLIAHFIYPFIDFWNLVEWHILIWIACIFFSGTLCITKPVLIVSESNKILRLFLDNYFFRIYRENLAIATFTLFLEGRFDMDFLIAMCIITVIIIIWEDLPLTPPDWLQCYGIPIVVQYGPFPEHVAILIPKQDPYRPYHTMSLANDYIELDRHARVIIELARKIIKAAPPIPVDSTRKAHLVLLRQIIVEEAVRLGFWENLEKAKRTMRKREGAFKHLTTMTFMAKAKAEADTAGIPESVRKDQNIAAGKKAAEVRQATAIRAEGAPGSDERKAWVTTSIDDLRRSIEGGRTTQLLACPRMHLHGTLDHASWLLHKVDTQADVVNSAAGYGQLATPVTEKEKDARAKLQDKAGATNANLNVRECTAAAALEDLLKRYQRHTKSYVFRAYCPHCSYQWLLVDKPGHANHTCASLRQWVLPILFDTWKERLAQEKEDIKDSAAEDSEPKMLNVTRVSYPGVFPWEYGESISEDPKWQAGTAAAGGTVRAKRTVTASDPLHIRALDLRGRLSKLCLKFSEFKSAAQLLADPLASSLFLNGQPIPIATVTFVTLSDFIANEANKKSLIEVEHITEAKLNAITPSPTVWLAVHSSLGATAANRILMSQAVLHIEEAGLTVTAPSISRQEIEAAYMEKIALRSLRPFDYDWTTGDDLAQLPTVALPSAAIPPSSTTETPIEAILTSALIVTDAPIASTSSASTAQ